MKRQLTEWRNYFAKCLSDRGLISRNVGYRKELKNKQEIKQPNQQTGY